MNLDTVSFTVTQPNLGLAMAAVAGDGLQIRNGARGSLILGVAMWTKSQSLAGFTQLTWPSGHDLVRGFRYRNVPQQVDNKVPRGVPLRFRAQDPLTVLEAGSNTAGDVELAHLMVFYEDLPGVCAHTANSAMLRRRGVSLLTVEDTITPTAASTYSGARAINAASDLLKADTEYAVLGATIGIVCGAITMRGVDTGNLRCPVPGNAVNAINQPDWFVGLSDQFDLPMVPIINSSNRAGILTEVVQDENLVAVPMCWHLLELAPPLDGAANQGTMAKQMISQQNA